MPTSDSIIRAVTNDSAFRVLAASTTATAAGVVRVQGARGRLARDLAELATGTILVRETMAPDLRLQSLIDAPGNHGRLLVDAHPDGGTRGLARGRDGAETDSPLGDGALLRVSRAMPAGKLSEGVVEIPAGANVAQALMTYLQESEQVVAVLALSAVLEADRVIGAAGYLVQLLPEADRTALAGMIARLDGFSLDDLAAQQTSARDILGALCVGLPYAVTDERPARYACRCSAERVLAAMATLSRADIEDAMRGGEPLEVRCDYCRKSYTIEVEALARVLSERNQSH